jgi:hypothetical protein
MADPDPLYFEVEVIVRRYIQVFSNRTGRVVSTRAARALLRRGESYAFQERTIDPIRVERSLDEIFRHLRSARSIVEQSDIENAMREAKCHYLWFC